MSVLGGILVILFAAFHGLATLPWLTQPRDPAAPTEELVLRVPLWARWMWFGASLMTAAGGVLVGLGLELGLYLAGLGMADICGLAVLNGLWMKGRPTVIHHMIRITIAAAIFSVALAGVI